MTDGANTEQMKQKEAEAKASEEDHTAELEEKQMLRNGSNANEVDQQFCEHDACRDEKRDGNRSVDRFPAGYREVVVGSIGGIQLIAKSEQTH